MTQSTAAHVTHIASAAPPEAMSEAPPAMAPDWAERVVEEFGVYVREELRRTLEAGRAYSTLVDGRVAWVHPDGVLRVDMAPDSAPLQRA